MTIKGYCKFMSICVGIYDQNKAIACKTCNIIMYLTNDRTVDNYYVNKIIFKYFGCGKLNTDIYLLFIVKIYKKPFTYLWVRILTILF